MAVDVLFKAFDVGLVGPITVRLIHHGEVPHYCDATSGNPGSNLIDFVDPERPVTGVLNLRRNQPKARLLPARFGKYFDFFVA